MAAGVRIGSGTSRTRLSSGRPTNSGSRKERRKQYAHRLAFMVADWSMGLLSDLASPLVAANSFRGGLFLLGLAAAPKKGRFKVARYLDMCFS